MLPHFPYFNNYFHEFDKLVKHAIIIIIQKGGIVMGAMNASGNQQDLLA